MGAGQLLQHAEPGNSGHQESRADGDVDPLFAPSLVQCLLLPRIGDFIAQHPTIHLNILTGQEIINLANRGVDLAMYFGKLPSGRHLDEAFMQESMVPICTPQYAAAHSLYDAPENLAHCTLLHDRYNSGEDEWQTWSQHFALGLDTDSKSMEFDRSDPRCWPPRGTLASPWGGSIWCRTGSKAAS